MKDLFLKKISDEKFNRLKIRAREAGNQLNTSSNFCKEISSFWEKFALAEINEYGKQWEIVAFFVLGVLQTDMKARNVFFWINTEVELDRMQVDVEINRHPIQLKYNWSDEMISTLKSLLSERGIVTINAKIEDSGIDVFREILSAAGFSSEAIEQEVQVNPGMDAAEEIFDWFVKGTL